MFMVGEGGPEFVHVQPLTGPNAPKGTKSSVTIPKAGNMRGGEGGGGSNSQPIIIHNKLMLNEREIASLVTKHAGTKRERHFR
ncbi:hypothetical protein BH18THE2_BH18THE2_09300 [soil metagenome]